MNDKTFDMFLDMILTIVKNCETKEEILEELNKLKEN